MARWITTEVQKLAKCKKDHIFLSNGQVQKWQIELLVKWKKCPSVILFIIALVQILHLGTYSLDRHLMSKKFGHVIRMVKKYDPEKSSVEIYTMTNNNDLYECDNLEKAEQSLFS